MKKVCYFTELKEEWKLILSSKQQLNLISKILSKAPEDCFDVHYDGYIKYRKNLLNDCIEKRMYKRIVWHYFVRKMPFSRFAFKNKASSYFKNSPWFYEFCSERKLYFDNIKINWSKILWLHDRLEDDRSRHVLTNVLMGRLTGDTSFYFANICDREIMQQYFDTDCLKFSDTEVFVDCGGYIGDTATVFLDFMKEENRKCPKIYLYEPDDINYEKAKNNLSDVNNIIIKKAGVGEKSGKLNFVNEGNSSSHMGDENHGNPIKIVSIDEDINERISTIKMDIEGAEISALLGAKKHIKTEHPKLAICIYHKPSDLVDIPLLIDEMDGNYRMSIRHYAPWGAETVLYCY